jgi:uncharacterized protein (TIGR03437 family)
LTNLANTQVFFSGIAAPMLFAQANQVNAIVPFEMAGRESATVEVLHNGQRTAPATISLVPAQPSIFAIRGATGSQGVILNQDVSLNAPANPADKGSVVSIFATGAGQTNPPGMNGAFALNDSIRPILPIEVLIGGLRADVISARVPRGLFAGLLQVDVRVPAGAASGAEINVSLAAGNILSPTVTMAIR